MRAVCRDTKGAAPRAPGGRSAPARAAGPVGAGCLALAVALALVGGSAGAQRADPLPSWRDGPAKQAIVDFVERVTSGESGDYVAQHARIAVFDNDGTLWSEQPYYFQLEFALDRIAELAPQHPEWASRPLFQAAIGRDLPTLLQAGNLGLVELITASHAGNTPEQFREIVRAWLKRGRHPRFDRRYDELVYQPMLEVLLHLRQHGFKNYIVTGGGIEFVRAFSTEVYHVPREQVIGSSIRTRFELHEGVPRVVREPDMDFVNDGAGKPVGIQKFIGRRPLAAFGNSDGDLQMLQWTAASPEANLAVVVHHTDEEREWAYDRESPIGRLDRALDQARADGWTVIDMKKDWTRIYPEP